MAEGYTTKDIVILKSHQAIRKRPCIYVGDIDDGGGLYDMIMTLVDNSVNEHLEGYCSNIAVHVLANGAVMVEDDGRGIPITEIDGISSLEFMFTKLHCGGHSLPGLHVLSAGAGLATLCALSEWLTVEVFRDDRHWRKTFSRGEKSSKLTDMGRTFLSGDAPLLNSLHSRLEWLSQCTLYKRHDIRD